jgi:hypothetical protein
MLNVIMLSVGMLNVIMLSIIVPNVDMLNVVALKKTLVNFGGTFFILITVFKSESNQGIL